MDPAVTQVFEFLVRILPLVAIIIALSIGGALLNNWLKIKNGYPLSNSWGMPLHLRSASVTVGRLTAVAFPC